MKPVAGLAATAVMAASIVASSGPVKAEPVNWSAIAQCESGGNWSANTGNGDYGGLQITQATWDANGGVGSPANATPQEQVQVANRIMATQGPGAWPSCTSRGRDPAVVPVGSLTHFMTFLLDQADGLSSTG